MALRGKFLHRLLLVAIILAATSASQKDYGCNRTCGSVNIPYPFGSSEGCYLDRDFFISCRYNVSFRTLIPYMGLGNVKVLNISLDGKLRISSDVARRCNNRLCGTKSVHTCPEIEVIPARLRLAQFRVSYEKNKITAVGCGTYVYIRGFDGDKYYTTGCLSLCDSTAGSNVVSGSCSGIGCCQTSIPKGARNYNLSVGKLDGYQDGRCGFGFIGDQDAFNFSVSDLEDLRGRESVPLVVDWAVGRNNCEVAKKNMASYACKAKNSYCYNSTNGPGYLCNCSSGYKGNPYLLDGCEDFNECETSNPCIGTAKCINLAGSFNCSCPKGYEGDGRKYGAGCKPRDNKSSTRIITIALGGGIGIALLLLLIGGSWLYKLVKKRKMIKLKEKFFTRNGGLLLKQQLFSSDANVENTKLFNSKELEQATDHFNVDRILGQGGQGTVFKGMLADGRIVAVKKSKVIDEGKLGEFINEVVILSRINHRNVVKLLGCCLETEVPLLVYEFISNGTLSQYLNDQNEEFPLTWDMRLRIATEVAGALFYLHSATSSPIYHRDIKSTNILLDDKYRAKVADFGTSRSVAIDQTHLTTLVYGTIGYLDPEYFQSSQFTEKSDVYSFGVVLAELLTGQKAISSTRTLETKSLAIYFIHTMEEDNLFDILDTQVLKDCGKEEIMPVANLTKRCLDLNGKKRPNMREVAIELEAIQVMRKASKLESG